MGKTKDNAIIGSRVLSRNEVLKVLPTFDNLFRQIEDLRNQITDIGDLNNEVLDKDGVAREIIQKNNAFAILGKRGTGKTSIMYTIRERLQREQEQDIFLPLLIPDNMSDNSDIMGAVLGMLSEVVKKQTKQLQSPHYRNLDDGFYDQNTCILKKENPLVLAYDEMCKVYCYLKPEYKQIISKGYTDLTSYISKSSDVLSADSQFKTVFNQFIYQLVKTQMMLTGEKCGNKIPLIHIFLDDIDLNPDRSGEIAKILLAYLAHPAVIVHISGDIDTFEEALTMSFLKTSDGMVEKELLDQEIVVGQKLLGRKQELAYEYLKKIIPPVYRQQLSYWSLKIRGLYAIGESCDEENLAAGEITLMDLLLQLFGENQVGGLFASYVKKESEEGNGEGYYEVFPLGYHIFDETSRGLNNVYLYLMQEYKRREEGKREGKAVAKPDKEYEFKKKFFDIVVNANPRLNKNRGVIDNILSWGEREEQTLIRLDNYSYMVEQFFNGVKKKEKIGWKRVSGVEKVSIPDSNEVKVMEYGGQDTDDTALEYFTIFELIYMACKVLSSVVYDEQELDNAKTKALELLWDYPIITESPVKIKKENWIHTLIELNSSESVRKTDKKLTENIEMEFVDLKWCLINLYAMNNFEIAIHYYQEIIREIGYHISENNFSQIKFLSYFAKVLSQFKNTSIIKLWCENNVSVLDYLFRNTTLDVDNMILNNLLETIVISEKSFHVIESLVQNEWKFPTSRDVSTINYTEQGICLLISRLIKNSIQEKIAIQFEKPDEVKSKIEKRLEKENPLIQNLLDNAKKSQNTGTIVEKNVIKNKINNLLNLKLLIAVIKENLTNQNWVVQLVDSNINLINEEIINSIKHNVRCEGDNINERLTIKVSSAKRIIHEYYIFQKKLSGVGTNTVAYKTLERLEFITSQKKEMEINDFIAIRVLVSKLASNYRVLYGRREAQEFLKILDNAGIQIKALEEEDSFLMDRILCYISYSITTNKNIDDLFESARLINELNRDIMETEQEYDQEIMKNIINLLELSEDDISSISDISAILEA